VRLAVAPDGEAVFVWDALGRDLRARRLTAGRLGPIVELTSDASWFHIVHGPAIDAAGNAVTPARR